MTRQRKSRKPGALGAKSQPKDVREHKNADAPPKAHKGKGKPPGNRHSIETNQAKSSTPAAEQKDPRVGSKRKIPLQAAQTKPASAKPQVAEQVTAKAPSVPAPAKAVLSEDITQAEDEFARLENDPRLQDLLAQLDAGDKISAQDNAWVETQLDRYRELAAELGIDIDDIDDEIEEEDDLEPWKKFDNPKDW